MKEDIEQKVRSREWTFNEISNLKSTIETLSNDLFIEMDFMSRFQLVREVKINESHIGRAFEDIMREIAMIQIQSDVAGTIKNMLGNATINFGGNKNEVSERSMGGESHQERSTDEKEDSVHEE
jgi:hypothetical protein